MKYHLMNKNIPIALIEIDGNIFNTVKILKNIAVLKDMDTLLTERFTPVNRKNTQDMLKKMGIKSTEEFIDATGAVSIVDALWIRSLDDNRKWVDINPYTNELDEVASNINLGLECNGEICRKATPELTLDGSFDKCWIRKDREIYLLKLSRSKWSESTGNESYSEVLCCQLAKALGIDRYVEYTCKERFMRNNDKVIQTECKCFASEDISYLPIAYTPFEYYDELQMNEVYKRYGDDKLYRLMLLMDCLTMNTDRHTGNYGFIYDNNTLKIIGMAPVFDNNMAFLPNVPLTEYADVMRVMSISRPSGGNFESFAELGAKLVSIDRELGARLNNLDGFAFHRTYGMESLSDKRLKFCTQLVKRQIREIAREYRNVNH